MRSRQYGLCQSQAATCRIDEFKVLILRQAEVLGAGLFVAKRLKRNASIWIVCTLDPLLNRRVIRFFGRRCNFGPDGIEVDIRHCGEQCFFVGQRSTFDRTVRVNNVALGGLRWGQVLFRA